MRGVIFFLLLGLVLFLVARSSYLERQLGYAQDKASIYEHKSEQLQNELLRLKEAYLQDKKIWQEIESSYRDLEAALDWEKTKQYVPKDTWAKIEPIIERLKTLGENWQLDSGLKDRK